MIRSAPLSMRASSGYVAAVLFTASQQLAGMRQPATTRWTKSGIGERDVGDGRPEFDHHQGHRGQPEHLGLLGNPHPPLTMGEGVVEGL